MTRVAVVGGGAAGTMVLVHLARVWPERMPLEVIVYDDTGRVGRGAAYSTREPTHLLNVPAGRMSALADDPDHFVQWVRRVDPAVTAEDYRPRCQYGEYLTHCLAQHARRAGLVVRHSQVSRLTRAGAAWTVRHDRGEDSVDAVVLALGHAPPAPLPGVAGAREPGYVHDPWAPGALEQLVDDTRPGDSTLAVGTGLTSVDVGLYLAARGRRVVAVSRRGLLPRVHVAPTPEPVPLADSLTGDGPLTAAGLEALVRTHIRQAVEAGHDWRGAVDGLRPVTSSLWRRLPLRERTAFLAGPARQWEVARHRMAPQVGASVAALMEAGSFTVSAGQVVAATGAGGAWQVTVRRADGTVDRLVASGLVNCTGPTCDVEGFPALAAQLVADGFARRDPLGLGVETTETGTVVDGRGDTDGLLCAVGALRRGSLYESTAVPELRTQAAEIADLLASKLAMPSLVAT